jgi:energy-coupling factor transport system permease protein
VLWLLVVVLVFQLAFARRIPTDPVLFSIGNYYITYKTMVLLAVIIVRFIAFMLIVTLFTSVTTEGDTVAGIEFLLRPIAPVSPAVHAFALMVNIIFRFIPILVGELEIIVKAQVSRGSPFGGRRFFTGPIKAIKDYIPLIVPVTLRSLDKALLLADAMDARCYRTAGRTQFRALMHSALQNVLLALGFIVPAAVLALDIFNVVL